MAVVKRVVRVSRLAFYIALGVGAAFVDACSAGEKSRMLKDGAGGAGGSTDAGSDAAGGSTGGTPQVIPDAGGGEGGEPRDASDLWDVIYE